MKLLFFTGSRGEWGYIRPILEICKKRKLDYTICANNMHLLDSYGLSIEEIERDGFKIHEKIFSALDGYNNITTAKSLISTLPVDSENLYVILSAREKNSEMLLISRASQMNSVHKLRVAGADNVIMPDKVGGAHMASLVAMPDVVEFLDHISIQGSDSINLEEICMEQLPDAMKKSKLEDIIEYNRVGVNVVGLKRSNGEYEINPSPKTEIDGACKLFVLGTSEQIRALNRMIKHAQPQS